MDWMITLQCFVSSNGDMGEGGIKNGKKSCKKWVIFYGWSQHFMSGPLSARAICLFECNPTRIKIKGGWISDGIFDLVPSSQNVRNQCSQTL